MTGHKFEFRKASKEIENTNISLLCGWSLIVISLILAYFCETLMGKRSADYFIIFALLTAVPNTISWGMYARHRDWEYFRYLIVGGYMFMYTFVLFTGDSILCFTYIIPLLSLLILYHSSGLILGTGTVVIVLNIFSIFVQYKDTWRINIKNIEIQLALIFLCSLGAYIVTRYYKKYIDSNQTYLDTIIKQIKQIDEEHRQTIMTIANMIDAKDSYTKGHSSRVADYSALIAYKLGMTREEIIDIHTIALLHDIGKVGIPDSILNKPGKLTDKEYQFMKKHTVIGGNILKDITTLPDIDLGAKYHHERYDGNGYPDGLKGKNIPYIARIISVADAFDAMTSNRVYRKHLNIDTIRAEIINNSGSQFDPDIADIMIELIDKGEIRLKYTELLAQLDECKN